VNVKNELMKKSDKKSDDKSDEKKFVNDDVQQVLFK